MNITLKQSQTISTEALAKARELGLMPLTVVVLDAAGVVVSVMREDNSSLMRPEIAGGKAWGTLALGLGGHELERRAVARPHFFNALSSISGGKIVPVAGGVLIRNADGHIVGAVGISGDTSDNDALCAVHGIEAVGLTADTGNQPS